MQDLQRIVFVLGPSGVGKSKFGQYLNARHRWLHLEIDRYPHGDGIDVENLRGPWDLFYESKSPAAIALELRERIKRLHRTGCVLTFPSGVLLSTDHILAAAKTSIRVTYLYGSAAHCINAFLEREHSSGRNLGLGHWLINNRETYLMMSRPEFESYRTRAFTIRGVHRSCETVLRDIRKAIKSAVPR